MTGSLRFAHAEISWFAGKRDEPAWPEFPPKPARPRQRFVSAKRREKMPIDEPPEPDDTSTIRLPRCGWGAPRALACEKVDDNKSLGASRSRSVENRLKFTLVPLWRWLCSTIMGTFSQQKSYLNPWVIDRVEPFLPVAQGSCDRRSVSPRRDMRAQLCRSCAQSDMCR
jgi:hypothetical protein